MEKKGQCFYTVVRNGTERYITLKKGCDMEIGLEIDNLIHLDETDRLSNSSSEASSLNNMSCHIETDRLSNNPVGLPSCGSDRTSDRLHSVNLPTPLTQDYDQQGTDRFSDRILANQSILKWKNPVDDDNIPIKATIGYSVRIVHSRDTNGSHQKSWTNCDKLPVSDLSEDKEVKLPDPLTDLYKRSIKGMTIEESQKVAKLLWDYREVFAKSDMDLGLFNGPIKHRIDTGNAAPVRYPDD